MFLKLFTVFGFLAVALGAFGAHGLKNFLADATDANLRLEWWGKAVTYQMWHTFLLGFIGILSQSQTHKWLQLSGYSTIAGILIFSGTLYTMTLTNIRILGAITPIGGLSLLAGWAFFGVWAFNQTT